MTFLDELERESLEQEQDRAQGKPRRFSARSREPSRYGPGRPSYWANITWQKDLAQPILDRFYAAIRELTTRERTALAHGLRCSRAAIWRWQKCQTTPDYGIMAQVIAWVEAGKPMIKKQHERYTMFSSPPIPKLYKRGRVRE